MDALRIVRGRCDGGYCNVHTCTTSTTSGYWGLILCQASANAEEGEEGGMWHKLHASPARVQPSKQRPGIARDNYLSNRTHRKTGHAESRCDLPRCRSGPIHNQWKTNTSISERRNRLTTAIAGDDPGRAGNGRDPWYPNWYSNIKTPAHIILLSSVSEYKSRPYFDQWALRALSGVFGTVNCGVVIDLKLVVP